jgi:GTP pyrophosphokinase/guanosine-3',5'-bis(diphosphate) 3'-pyrophosphohydrolase
MESAELRLVVSVRDRTHLAEVMRGLHRAPAVMKASRIKP